MNVTSFLKEAPWVAQHTTRQRVSGRIVFFVLYWGLGLVRVVGVKAKKTTPYLGFLSGFHANSSVRPVKVSSTFVCMDDRKQDKEWEGVGFA